jgi:glycerate dehydrogenase
VAERIAAADLVRQGAWSAGSDFCFWQDSLTELAGPTLGVVGLGMEVIAHQRGSSGGMACDGTMPVVPLKELLERSELVSLHCPLPPRTLGLIDGARLATMKPGALLITTGSGPLMLEADLAVAANAAGILAGARA